MSDLDPAERLTGEGDERVYSSWTPTSLADVVTLQRGKDLPKSDRVEGPYPVIGSNGIVGYHSTFAAKGPGVLVGRSGSVGKVSWVDGAFWPLNTSLWARDFHGNDPLFVYYLLSFLHLRRYATGVSVPTLNRNLLADIQVLLPSVDEQRAIARVLRTVQRVKEQTEQVVEASTRLLQSLALNLFGPLEADAAMVQRPLGELVEVLDRMRVPLNRAERAKRPGKYPYCGANGIVDYIDGYLFEGEHLLVAEDGGEWGRFESSAYLMDGRFWVNNHAHILRAHDDVTTNVFLMHYLNYADIQSFISGSTRGKLNQGVLKSIPVPLPSLAEQMRITQALEAVGRKHRSEVNRAAALAHLFTTLLQELMTGRTRADDVAGAS